MEDKAGSSAVARIYTDGSCHPQTGTGGWAAVLLLGDDTVRLSGYAIQTTHQAMELTAAVAALRHVHDIGLANRRIRVYTDSQYLAGLPARRKKMTLTGLTSAKGRPLSNGATIMQLFALADVMEVEFIKIRAHAKATQTPNHNREVDQISRKIVRTIVRNMYGAES